MMKSENLKKMLQKLNACKTTGGESTSFEVLNTNVLVSFRGGLTVTCTCRASGDSCYGAYGVPDKCNCDGGQAYGPSLHG